MQGELTLKRGGLAGFWKDNRIRGAFLGGDIWTKISFVILGLSNIMRGQIVKGLLFLGLEASFIAYMARTGVAAFQNLITLGTREQDMVFDEAEQIFVVMQGDNSMLMLLYGVAAIFVVVFFAIVWASSVLSAYKTQIIAAKGQKPPGIADEIRDLLDNGLHKTLLLLPVTGLILFTVVPLVYMILMAFTNYDQLHQPPGKLFEWVGVENFRLILGASKTIAKTFWPILGWTMTWAVFATFTNYFFGMLLAILINSKGINYKRAWRTVFVLTAAIPIFATLLGIRLMLGEHGVFNLMLLNAGLIEKPLPFLLHPTWARTSVIVVNMWVGIPHSMLITTGILMNIPAELYESARIDGAGSFMTYRKITMPYMLFVTAPYLITQFVANINNFGVIYYLTKGNPNTLDYFKGAGKTDLLVTWLYKLTKDSKDYNLAATIGIIIFIISAAISLIVFQRSGAYRNEEAMR